MYGRATGAAPAARAGTGRGLGARSPLERLGVGGAIVLISGNSLLIHNLIVNNLLPLVREDKSVSPP